MLELATITPNHTLQLPAAIAQRFSPADQFIVWQEGDTLYLKRLIPSPLTLVENAPDDDEPISLDEISDIVHLVRQRRTTQEVL
ncbi:MAG: hypothetical protein OT477_00170 [Chloroflexi bacterium]|nr:hypothetical protein [Chloroflexota bacterium]